jgi:hypothetical protein
MTDPNDPNNSKNPYHPDSLPPAFVLVAIPLGTFVPVEVLEGVEIFMTQGGGGNDDDAGDDGVALAS